MGRIYELSYRSKREKTQKYHALCETCGSILTTDKDIAEFVAGAHMRDPQYEGHKAKVMKASEE